MNRGLPGKVAAITGGSAGIGRATAFRFCEEGARVAICARCENVLQTAAKEIEAATGGEVLAVRADVTGAADRARFLASERARDITGTAINIDGGISGAM